MDFILPFTITPSPKKIQFTDSVFLIGSCFTTHLASALAECKINVLENPRGILFDTLSIFSSLQSFQTKRVYQANELFFFNDLWFSFDHHSSFSATQKEAVLERINQAQQAAGQFLKQTQWLVITLGTSFAYQFTEQKKWVANCHKLPNTQFTKTLLPIDQQYEIAYATLSEILKQHPQMQVVLTISPVRHHRDGAVQNNQSKARLIEITHQLCNALDRVQYFPAYELLIDVLRDYRFYDIDLVHPNFAATQYVVQKLIEHFFEPADQGLIKQLKQLSAAFKHRPLFPNTKPHQDFAVNQLSKINELKIKHPYFDFRVEEQHFKSFIPSLR